MSYFKTNLFLSVAVIFSSFMSFGATGDTPGWELGDAPPMSATDANAYIVYQQFLAPAKAAGKTCDCSYKGKGLLKAAGCVISRPAPANTACKCSYKGAWTCGGELVDCITMTMNATNTDYSFNGSPKCKTPAADLESCQVGKGDCGGY